MEDYLGNETTTNDDEALAGINSFVSGFLGYGQQAVDVLTVADRHPDSTLANIYSGLLFMFLESPAGPEAAAPYFKRAEKTVASSNRREAMLHEVLDAWMQNDMPKAEKLAGSIVEEYPRDLAAMKLGQYFAFNRGDFPRMLSIALSCRDKNLGNANWHGMAAFGYEQCHRLEKAERAARSALEIDKDEAWAHHALAHVMLTQGRVREGAEFLAGVADSWKPLNSFMYTHNWWHRALFSISLGDEQSVFDAYDKHCWTREKDYSQDQINAVSLLARMECAGINVGNRWQELADHLKARHSDTFNAFLSLQYLYGLAKAGRAEADQLMEAIKDKAETAAGFEKVAWSQVAVPAACGMLAHARGDHQTAIRELGTALPRMAETGGSHAQRDLFEQLLLDAHLKSGNLSIAQQMMEMRRTFDPDGVPLNRMLSETYEKLGLNEEAAEARSRRYQ